MIEGRHEKKTLETNISNNETIIIATIYVTIHI